MTNKERLEANNKRIDEILQNLENKIVMAIDDSGITVELPEAFKNSNAMYYVKISNDKILISSNSAGLYEYTISSKSWKFLYNEGSYRSYDTYIQVSKIKWVVGGFGGTSAKTLLYNSENGTVTDLGIKRGYGGIKQVSENKCLFVSTTSGNYDKGIYKLNLLDDSVEQIYTEGNYLGKITELPSGKFLIMSTQTGFNKFLIYNPLNDEFLEIESDLYNLQFSNYIGNKVIFSANSYRDWYVFDEDSFQFTQFLQTEKNSLTYIVKNSKALIYTSQATGKLYVFNVNDSSVKELTTSAYNPTFIDFENGDTMICSTSVEGLYLYRFQDDSYETITASGKAPLYYTIIENRIVLRFTSGNTGIFVYTHDDNSFVKIANDGYYSGNHLKISDSKYLLFATQHFIIYNPITNEAVDKGKLNNMAKNFNVYEKDNIGNYYLSCSNKDSDPPVIYYNSTTDETFLARYYLEGV